MWASPSDHGRGVSEDEATAAAAEADPTGDHLTDSNSGDEATATAAEVDPMGGHLTDRDGGNEATAAATEADLTGGHLTDPDADDKRGRREENGQSQAATIRKPVAA